jgi:hypothetical protein
MYRGLNQYSHDRPDPLARRVGESEQNWMRRTAVHRRHADEAAESANAEWAEHRSRVDAPVGQGSGLFGRATGQDQAASLRGWNGGAQAPPKNGHLANTSVRGQVAISRVYANDLQDQPAVSPLVAHLKSSGDGWFTR